MTRVNYSVDTTRLKIALAVNNLTNLSKFARETGLSRETIGRILKGDRPSSETIIKIAVVLNLSTQDVAEIFFVQGLRNA